MPSEAGQSPTTLGSSGGKCRCSPYMEIDRVEWKGCKKGDGRKGWRKER